MFADGHCCPGDISVFFNKTVKLYHILYVREFSIILPYAEQTALWRIVSITEKAHSMFCSNRIGKCETFCANGYRIRFCAIKIGLVWTLRQLFMSSYIRTFSSFRESGVQNERKYSPQMEIFNYSICLCFHAGEQWRQLKNEIFACYAAFSICFFFTVLAEWNPIKGLCERSN